MKNIIIFTIIFTSRAPTINSVVENSLKINAVIELNYSASELTAIIGRPTSISSEYWATTEENVEKYNYSNTYFQFVDGQLKSFKLCSSQYSLKVGSYAIEIGSSINGLVSSFPDSYSNKSDGYMSINIQPGDYQYILIEYDLADDSIKPIEHRFY